MGQTVDGRRRKAVRPALAATSIILTLAGCERQATPAEQEMADQRAIAAVEKANGAQPPLEEVVPQPLTAMDIERYDLLGPACNYAPGTSLGTRVIARPADAWIKIDGEVERMAADPGARELPQGTRSLYNGTKHSLRLQVADPRDSVAGSRLNYEGTVTLRDQYGRVVYEGTGLAQCNGDGETASEAVSEPA